MPKDYDKIPAPTKGSTQFSKIPENTTVQRRKRISERSAGTMAYGKVKRIPAVKLIPEVIRLREAGANVPTIARTIGRSERYVRMLLQRSKGDGSQVFVQPQPKDLAKVADKYQGCLEKTGVGFEQFFLLFSGYDYLPRHAKHWVQDFLDNRRLLLNVPPGHAKSEIMSVWLPLWLICLNRNEQILIISKTNDLVQKFTRSISYQMEANLDLISAFGRFAPEPGSNWAWRPNSGELLVAGREREAQSGDLSIQIRGSGQQVYGFRATTVICDDPTDEKISDSEAERKKLSGWFHKQVMSRLDPKAKVVVIGQRVHPLDLYGELADERKTRVKDSPLAWHQIKYPAVLDWGDPEAGIEPTVLWPERWTFEDLMEQYINVGGELGFQTLYQQDPMSEGDTLVKPEWITGDNPGCLDRDRRTGTGYSDLDNIVPVVRVISIDPSPTRYTGIIVGDVPYSQKTFGCAIIEVKKARLQLRDLVNEISFLLDKYHPDYLIFEKSGFSGWLYEDPYFQVIKQRVKVISHQTTGKSKGDPEYGIWGMGIDFEYGRVRLPYADPESRDNSRILVDEATVYPYGATDDVLMALWFIKFNHKGLYPLKHLATKIGLFQGRYPDVPTSWASWKTSAGTKLGSNRSLLAR